MVAIRAQAARSGNLSEIEARIGSREMLGSRLAGRPPIFGRRPRSVAQTRRRRREQPMTTTVDDLLPTAKDLMKTLALAESEKAAESARQHAAEEAEKKALIDHFVKPSGVSDEERMKRAAIIIQRAVSNGMTEVQFARFPNSLCSH